ncbi:MAG: hypothetical protein WB987_04910 [Candidatus Acidiferrales bacterium]
MLNYPPKGPVLNPNRAQTQRTFPVDRNYDLFEIFPDGSPIWKCAVAGHENAVLKLRELASQTVNEVRIMHLPSNTIIATMNVPPA